MHFGKEFGGSHMTQCSALIPDNDYPLQNWPNAWGGGAFGLNVTIK